MGGSNGRNAMLIHRLATLTGLAVATLFMAAPANALTMAECSTKYNAAKDAWHTERTDVEPVPQSRMRHRRGSTTDTKPAKKPAKTDAKAAATDDERQGPDGQGMQRQVSGRQGRRHAQRHEVERLPQDRMRRRRTAAAEPAKATTKAAAAADDERQGPDGQGMQHQIPGRQGRRHAERHEVERLPQDRMRRRRNGRGRTRQGDDQGRRRQRRR